MIEFVLSSTTYNRYVTGAYMLEDLGKHATVTPIGVPTTTPGSQWHLNGKGSIYMPTGTGYRIGTTYPTDLWIDANSNFEISGNFYVTDTALKVIFGNLNDDAGYGHFWLVFNDQTNFGIALYGANTAGGVAKFAWMSGTKFPINRWVNIVIKRVGTLITLTIDGVVSATTYTFANGFLHHNFPLVLGQANGARYSMNGYLNDFKFLVTPRT